MVILPGHIWPSDRQVERVRLCTHILDILLLTCHINGVGQENCHELGVLLGGGLFSLGLIKVIISAY